MRFKAGKCFSGILLLGILAIGLACSKAPDDTQMTGQIQSRLTQDSGLHDKQIAVQTSDGVVTLSGTVENETQRETAARYASATPGIRQVVNNLEIASASAPRVANQMAQAPPAPVRPAPEPTSDRRRPRTPRHHRMEPNSNEMAAAAPPPAETHNPAPDENLAPTPPPPAPPPPHPSPPPPNLTLPTTTSL